MHLKIHYNGFLHLVQLQNINESPLDTSVLVYSFYQFFIVLFMKPWNIQNLHIGQKLLYLVMISCQYCNTFVVFSLYNHTDASFDAGLIIRLS